MLHIDKWINKLWYIHIKNKSVMFSFHVIHEMGTISKAHEETFTYDDVLYYN